MSAIEPSEQRGLEPAIERGHHVWRATLGEWQILCRGRSVAGSGSSGGPGPPDGVRIARLRQIHSDRIVDAAPGLCGEGDALVVSRAGLAAAVVTADCVPVALAAGPVAATVHAGWRGIAAGIVPRAVERVRAASGVAIRAWIGPAVGPCCYEVGTDVAGLVVAASAPSVRIGAAAGRAPRLDLRLAVRTQLEARGVAVDDEVPLCTRCHPEWLWSYRRDGPGGGRIETYLWRE